MSWQLNGHNSTLSASPDLKSFYMTRSRPPSTFEGSVSRGGGTSQYLAVHVVRTPVTGTEEFFLCIVPAIAAPQMHADRQKDLHVALRLLDRPYRLMGFGFQPAVANGGHMIQWGRTTGRQLIDSSDIDPGALPPCKGRRDQRADEGNGEPIPTSPAAAKVPQWKKVRLVPIGVEKPPVDCWSPSP